MNFKVNIRLEDLARFLNCPYKGNPDLLVSGVSEMHKIETGHLIFIEQKHNIDSALNSNANAILIQQEIDFPDNKGLLISSEPFKDFNKLINHYFPFKPLTKSQGENCIIGNSTLGPNVILGHNVTIGDGCIIHAGVVIGDNSVLKDNVIIGPNSVIGSDAFYYKKKNGVYNKMQSCGGTILEDNVEIGALTTIDRGVTGNTHIGRGTKIYNQVHIGHDTFIGENCLFAANVGVSGCVTIENNVTLWGQVGVISDITIEKGVVVYAQSGVAKNLAADKTYFGSLASDSRTAMKEIAAVKKLPSIIESI